MRDVAQHGSVASSSDRSDPRGRIVILNGPPRSGKSSIAAAMQRTLDGVWMNLGVDAFKEATPERFQPGIGLRPGGERPDLEPLIATLYRAMYASVAAHSKLGVDVVTDVGHHDDYSEPLGILPTCARLLHGLPVLVVGVRCPNEEVWRRREWTWGQRPEPDGSVPVPVLRWQDAVHEPGIYDVELDTSRLTAEQCAALIGERIRDRPFGAGRDSRGAHDARPAIERLAALADGHDPEGESGPIIPV